MTQPTTITLHLVSYVQPAKLTYRSIEYVRKLRTLVAVKEDEGLGVPFGLKRILASELPKVGGLYGTAAVAVTIAEAEEAIFRVLIDRRDKARQDLACWEAGIALLTR